MKMYVIRSLESLAPSRRPSRRDRTPFPSRIHTLAVGVRCEIFPCRRLLLWLLSLHSLDDGSDLACSFLRGLRPTKAEEFCVFCHVHSYEYLHYMLG